MSLRARLLAASAYTLLIVIVALEVPLAANLSDRVNAEVEADSAAQAQVVAASIADQLDRPARLEQVTAEASESLGGLVFVIDGDGRVLADSVTGVAAKPVPTDDPIALDALRGEIAQGRHTEGGDVLSTAVPIVRNGRTIGALEVEQSLDSVNDEIRQDVAALVGIGVLALGLGLGVAWILAGSISRPLNALAAVARRRAEGDVEARAEPRGSSEQVEVANAFNEMADKLGAMLESQREFVADASHQLRTPLTGLRLRLEAAAAKSGSGEAADELTAAEHETERLSAVVGDLLALASSEEPAERQEAGLRSAAEAAASRWRDSADEQGRELAVADGPETVVATGERDLAVILDNLIENAIKYSPRGSEVEIGWEARDGRAALTVANAGGPLGDEERERAFERFYRGGSSRGRRGTGLGLPIVAALARRSGGSARLANRPGGGVIAEVTLPRGKGGGFAES